MSETHTIFNISEVIPDLAHGNRRNYTLIEFSDKNKNMILRFYFNNHTHLFEILRLIIKNAHVDATVSMLRDPSLKENIYSVWDDFKDHPDLASYPKVRLKLLFA